MTQTKMKRVDYLWVLPIEEGYKIGLTVAAQDDLGKISFATFPKVGQTLTAGDTLVELEAEKSVSEFTSPLSGTVKAINEAALNDPSVLDDDDQINAWIAVLTDVSDSEFEKL
ncbi:glycine cleavage system protein H [Enterococcus faecalis]